MGGGRPGARRALSARYNFKRDAWKIVRFARMLAETADLMEIAAEDGFRIRSYRNAASAIEGYPERIEDIPAEPGAQGHRGSRHRQRHCGSARRNRRSAAASKSATRCWRNIRRRCSNFSRSRALGPKGIALVYQHYKVRHHRRTGAAVQRAKAARTSAHGRQAGREGSEVDRAIPTANRAVSAELRQARGRRVDSVSGRGRRAGEDRGGRQPAARQGDHRRSRFAGDRVRRRPRRWSDSSSIPKRTTFSAKARTRPASSLAWKALQVDLRALAHESYGAAMQYFTGSKEHNIVLRSRALKLGLTLNEYGLFRLEGDAARGGRNGRGRLRQAGPGLDSAGAARELR